MKNYLVTTLLFSVLTLTSQAFASPAGNAGIAISNILKALEKDKNAKDFFIEPFRQWVEASVQQGSASFVDDVVVFKLLEEEKVIDWIDDKKTFEKMYEANGDLVGERLRLKTFSVDKIASDRTYYKVDIVAVDEPLERNKEGGGILFSTTVSKETFEKITKLYRKALDDERNDIRPRGGFTSPIKQ